MMGDELAVFAERIEYNINAAKATRKLFFSTFPKHATRTHAKQALADSFLSLTQVIR